MSTPLSDPSSRVTAADLAAGALLGALLWDPRRIDDVANVLEAEDFGRWDDRAIYQTLVGMRRDGRRIDVIETVPAALQRSEYHDAYMDLSDGQGPLSPYALSNLLSLTPAPPPAAPRADGADGPQHSEHVRYARLVQVDSIRRQVRAAGARIDQCARHTAGAQSDDAAELLAPVLAEVQQRLQGLTGRRAGVSGPAASIEAALSPQQPSGRRADREASVWSVGGRAEPSERALRRAEYTLIGACMVSPEVLEMVAARLQATDFQEREIGATWTAISTLHRRGEPVDFVLVAAEVEQQGKLDRLGRGLSAEQLAHVMGRLKPTRVAAYPAMETVVRAALTRAVRAAGERLQNLAEDRSRSNDRLLGEAREAVRGAEDTLGRLTDSTPAKRVREALRPPAGRPAAPRKPAADVPPPRQSEPASPDRTMRRR